jgi:hypothetical protein
MKWTRESIKRDRWRGPSKGRRKTALRGRKHDALFVGQWAAPFLLLGIYNKLVKVAGHDKDDEESGKSERSALI